MHAVLRSGILLLIAFGVLVAFLIYFRLHGAGARHCGSSIPEAAPGYVPNSRRSSAESARAFIHCGRGEISLPQFSGPRPIGF